MSRDEMAAHAERVFRRHNQAETRLLSALQSLSIGQPEAYEALLEAEAGMLDACEKLNEFAIRRRDNKRMGIIEKRRIPGTIKACDTQTQIVEELLAGMERAP